MKEQKAYDIMFQFLDDRYARLPSDALGSLLGELQLHFFTDGLPADPAVVEDWEKAVAAVEAEQQPVLEKAS